MKKKVFRALALLLTTVLFFNLVFFNHAQKVHAALPPVVIWVLSAVGGYALNEFVLEPINEKLGWSDSDIKTDSEGNVIISPEQMEEIKAAAEDVVLAEHGAFIYSSTATSSYYSKVSAFADDYGTLWSTNNPVPLSTQIVESMWYSKTSYGDPHIMLLSQAAFWVRSGTSLTEPAVQFYDSNGNLLSCVENWYFDFNGDSDYGQGWALYRYSESSASTAAYYGPDTVCFNSYEDLQNYLGLSDEEKPFLMPVTNPDGTVSNNTIPAYDPGTGTVIEIEFTYDDSMDLVFTPEGYLYLNYTDIDNDGVPDDHDPEVDGSGDTVGTQIMRAGTITYTGTGTYGSGNPCSLTFDHVPIHVWIHSDNDDGYTIDADFGVGDTSFTRVSSKGTSSAIRQNSLSWSEDSLTATWYSSHNASAQCNGNGAEYTVTYTYYDYVDMGGNPSGGGSADLTETNGILKDILKWIKKIYNQVVVGNVLTGVDMLVDALDELGEDLSAGAAAAAEAFTGIIFDLFPFCFIYDIFLIIDMFVAEPVAPIFEIEVDLSPLGLHDPLLFVIDLTPYDDTFKMLRIFEILFFIAGLMHLTYGWIVGKGDAV